MLEQEFADQTCRDAKGTQRRNAAYFGYQFNSESDNLEKNMCCTCSGGFRFLTAGPQH